MTRVRFFPSCALAAVLLLGTACTGHDPEAGTKGAAEQERAHEDEHGQVKLTQDQQRIARIKVEPAQVRPLSAVLTTTGEIEAPKNSQAQVTPRTSGHVTAIHRQEGDRVVSGTVLATLRSEALAQLQGDYLQGLIERSLAKSVWGRQQLLFKDDIIARKEVQRAEADFRKAESAVESLANRLRIMGAPDLQRLAKTRQVDPSVPIVAPIGGIVTAQTITMGQFVEPSTSAFAITGIGTLWAQANLYERDLGQVQVGQSALVSVKAYPNRHYAGRVTHIDAVMDPETRTAHARVTVQNRDGRLKPEMYATIRIEVGNRRVLALPDTAVLMDKEEAFTFVRTGAETFQRRVLQLGPKSGGSFPVLAGLKAGEPVVVAGGFILKSELLKEGFGEHED